MTTLWAMHETTESAAVHLRIALRHPSRSLIANRHELTAYPEQADSPDPRLSGEATDARSPPAMAIPTLVISDPDYAPNLFFEGLNYASQRLRETLNLPPRVVRCGAVDARECAESARSASYCTFEPLHIGDPIDRERSDGEWLETVEADGGSGRIWVPAGGPTRPAPRIALRHDFNPPAPVFRLSNGGAPIVIDEIADRVVHAKLTDIMFIQLGQERGQTENICKRL